VAALVCMLVLSSFLLRNLPVEVLKDLSDLERMLSIVPVGNISPTIVCLTQLVLLHLDVLTFGIILDESRSPWMRELGKLE